MAANLVTARRNGCVVKWGGEPPHLHRRTYISCPRIMSSKRLARLQFGKLATGLRRVCVNTGFVCYFVCYIGDEFWAMSFGT
jgi:hypothetical protein